MPLPRDNQVCEFFFSTQMTQIYQDLRRFFSRRIVTQRYTEKAQRDTEIFFGV